MEPQMQFQSPSYKHLPKLSFGVELEFLFYFRTDQKQKLRVRDDRASVPWTFMDARFVEKEGFLPAPMLPQNIKLDSIPLEEISQEERAKHAQGWAENLIAEAISTVPGARVEGYRFGPDGQRWSPMYVFSDIRQPGGCWEVKDDGSVRETEVRVDGYSYVGIEVTSPALWDIPESYQHIHNVVQMLTSQFYLRVNPRCGFHVHVGNGREIGKSNPRPHSLQTLRTAAALTWAADGVLSTLHPPERGINQYSMPTRFLSRLANGLMAVVKGAFPQEIIIGAAKTSNLTHTIDRTPSDSFPRSGDRFYPAIRMDPVDRAHTQRYQMLALGRRLAARPSRSDLINKTVLSGMDFFRTCPDAETLAATMYQARRFGASENGWQIRLNYNFNKYFEVGTIPEELDFEPEDVASRTVEFREAAGSLSADWIVTWSRICVGLFRFANNATLNQVQDVIGKLALAEEVELKSREEPKKREYDVISFLTDIGLFSEALFVEKMLGDEGGCRVWYPNFLAWGESLEFHPSNPRAEMFYHRLIARTINPELMGEHTFEDLFTLVERQVDDVRSDVAEASGSDD
jgi:hypothetical protein